MSLATWITFFFAACLIAISPGSGAVLSMSHGLAYGVRKTSMTILGLQAGLLLILAIAGAGVGSILVASETLFTIVKTVGALYLIWLGLSQWRAQPADASVQGQGPGPVPAPRKRFLQGFFTNATNPKGIVFMVAVLPQFISAQDALLPQLLILAVTMCAVDLVVMHGYAGAASALQRVFKSPRALRMQNRVFGGVLMAMGATLFFVKRGGQSA